MQWADKRYHSLDYFLKNTFGRKVGKISLNAGLSCPNRDGRLSRDGCIFCAEGSLYFDELKGKTITDQFYEYKKRIDNKWKDVYYIAYFQSFTNTYGDLSYLERIYYEASEIENVVAVSIATRPDCLGNDVLKLIEKLNKKIFVFVELGLQTSNEASIKLINRCYQNDVYVKAVSDLKSIGVNVVTHTILGLPYETKQDMLNTVKFVQQNKSDGIKLQLLHVLNNTALAQMYSDGLFEVLTLTQYTDIVVSCLEILSPDMVIHRINGDSPKEMLIAPLFCLNKRSVLNSVDKSLRANDSWQGKFY